MISIENTDVMGWEPAVRGMRNPMNSWDKSDSDFDCKTCDGCYYESDHHKETAEYSTTYWCNHRPLRIGNNDLTLMQKLIKAGSDHSKFMRMIVVYCDITAPLYWWKEYDTYKVGTVANSCSTMHKIHAKEFTLDDFSHERLKNLTTSAGVAWDCKQYMEQWITLLNVCRREFIKTNDKSWWWQMIQLLPSSYNQRRTVELNYAVLRNMYHARKNHKLDEWHTFCEWVETLPYAKELICCD